MSRRLVLTVTRAQNGFDDAGFPAAFERAGFDTINFDDRTFLWYEANGRIERLVRRALRSRQRDNFNRALQRYIETCRPALLFAFKGDAISAATIHAARKAGVRTVFLYPDLEPAVQGQSYLDAIRQADMFLHTKPNLADHFHRTIRPDARFLYPVYDPALVSPPCEMPRERGLLVVAHHSPGKAELIRQIAAADAFDIKVYGSGWASDFPQRVALGGPLFGPMVRDLQRNSTAVLGLLTEQLANFAAGDAITARSVHVPAYGGLLLHQATPDARVLYDSDEPLFADVPALVARMRGLVDSPTCRLAMAQRQQAAVLANSMSTDDVVSLIQQVCQLA